MRSGCPLPRRSLSCMTTLESNGVHHNMGITQYPEELKLAYSPVQRQQGNTQTFQGLHQLESRANTASTGFHHPQPRDSSRSHQVSRKAYFGLSHVPAQHSSYCGTSANENSARLSNMNIDTGLQQGQCLDFASFVNSTSSALEGDAFCFATKTEPKYQESHQLLYSTLKGNNFNINFNEPSSSTSFSDERYCTSQQVPARHDQIQDYIWKMVAYSNLLDNNNNNNGNIQSDLMSKTNSFADPPKKSTFGKEYMRRQSLTFAVTEQCATAVRQALEEDRSNGCKENVALTPESKEMSDNDASAPKKHSTEYLQIMGKVSDICTKKEDQSRMTMDELTAKHPSSLLNCSSSQEDNYSPGLNMFSEKKKADTFVKPAGAVGLDNVQGVADVSKDLQTMSSSVASETTSTSTTDIQIHNVVSFHVNQALSLKDPQYEDISDDEDMSWLTTRLPKTEHAELIFPACEVPHYENISEDENPHIENMVVERPSPKHVSEPNSRLSPYENESYGQMNPNQSISDEKLIPMKPQTETLEEPSEQCCSDETLGWQTKHCVSSSPSSALRDDLNNDETDDDWIVIPLTVSDLTFEPEDEDQECPEELFVGDKEIQCHTSPICHEYRSPTPPPNQLEEYDTMETYLKAMQVKYKPGVTLGWCMPEYESDSDGESTTPQNKGESYSEPDDCETDDSCDYPSGSKHNYLTVSRELLKKGTEHLPLETEDSVFKKESEDDLTYVQKGQTRSLDTLGIVQKLRPLIQAKTACEQLKTNRQESFENDIITIDSDTEDESDPNCKKKPERKRLFSSGSNSSEDALCSQQKRYSPAPQHQSMHDDSQFKEVVQEACTDLSHSTEVSGQLFGTKGGFEHVQHGQESSSEEIIIIDSDIEDDNDTNYKKACTRDLFSSGSVEGDDAPSVPQKMHSPKTVNSECETPADSLLPQHQSKPCDTQFKEVTQDAWPDLLHGREKRGQPIEGKSGSENARHNTNKPGMSENRRNAKRICPLESKDNSDVLFATKRRHMTEGVEYGAANKKLKKPRLLPEDSAKPRTDTNPVIPSRSVLDSSQATKNSVLLKKARVHMQGNDESWAKKTHSYEKTAQHSYSKERGRHVSKPNDRHSTKNEVQANIAKPRHDKTRQLLFPFQEGPCNSTGSSNGRLSEARQGSASCRSLSQSRETSSCLPKSKQCAPVHRQHLPSSDPQLSRSYSSPSTLGHPFTTTKATSFSATKQTPTRTLKLIHPRPLPPGRQKKSKLGKGMHRDSRTKNYDLSRDTRPGPSQCYRAHRQRHKSYKSEPPLLKKTRSEAIQRTKDINPDAPQKRCSVGDNYKWSEKLKSAKGSSR